MWDGVGEGRGGKSVGGGVRVGEAVLCVWFNCLCLAFLMFFLTPFHFFCAGRHRKPGDSLVVAFLIRSRRRGAVARSVSHISRARLQRQLVAVEQIWPSQACADAGPFLWRQGTSQREP